MEIPISPLQYFHLWPSVSNSSFWNHIPHHFTPDETFCISLCPKQAELFFLYHHCKNHCTSLLFLLGIVEENWIPSRRKCDCKWNLLHHKHSQLFAAENNVLPPPSLGPVYWSCSLTAYMVLLISIEHCPYPIVTYWGVKNQLPDACCSPQDLDEDESSVLSHN